MAIDFSMYVDGDLLTVTTSGFDENLDDTTRYGEKVIQACIDNQCGKILVDETRMTAVLDKVNQYELVQRLRVLLPANVQVAMVVNPECYADTAFGAMVAENRGINIRIFTAVNEAKAWLQTR